MWHVYGTYGSHAPTWSHWWDCSWLTTSQGNPQNRFHIKVMIGRKIGALCAKKPVVLHGSCRLPTARGHFLLIPEHKQDGDTSERQRRLPSISSIPVGTECRVARQDSVRWAGMARQLRAAKRSDRQVPACAGHASWPTDQDKSSPAAKPCWTNASTSKCATAPPCTDILAY